VTSNTLTLSKAVLHALGCVATKMGLVDMIIGYTPRFLEYFPCTECSISRLSSKQGFRETGYRAVERLPEQPAENCQEEEKFWPGRKNADEDASLRLAGGEAAGEEGKGSWGFQGWPNKEMAAFGSGRLAKLVEKASCAWGRAGRGSRRHTRSTSRLMRCGAGPRSAGSSQRGW
jgi:hypothetical protein